MAAPSGAARRSLTTLPPYGSGQPIGTCRSATLETRRKEERGTGRREDLAAAAEERGEQSGAQP